MEFGKNSMYSPRRLCANHLSSVNLFTASSQNASTPLSTSTENDIATSHRSVCKMNRLLPGALVRCLSLLGYPVNLPGVAWMPVMKPWEDPVLQQIGSETLGFQHCGFPDFLISDSERTIYFAMKFGQKM